MWPQGDSLESNGTLEEPVVVVGGGLAGCEAAWQIAARGRRVDLYEMRPAVMTPAHVTEQLAELVCSNSFKSNRPTRPVGLLKEELRLLGSLLIAAADQESVPAGDALAVDRRGFARRVTDAVAGHERIRVIRKEIAEIPSQGIRIIATGPLTSDRLASSLADLVGAGFLYFYDAISPIVAGDSIRTERAFWGSRYGRGGGDGYLNCPLTRTEYESFVEAVLEAQVYPLRDFEEGRFFQGCSPIEDIARTGFDSLAFGCMRPVGLVEHSTGRRPHAVLQLRRETVAGDAFALVGCQTRMRQSEQRRVFRLIPALEDCEFLRYGSLHRNTYVCGPQVLRGSGLTRFDPTLLLAGQITGVEGYVESIASGYLAGLNAVRLAQGLEATVPPPESAIGALVRHVEKAEAGEYQPMNINRGLFPPLEEEAPETGDGRAKRKKLGREEKGRKNAERALLRLERWREAEALLGSMCDGN